MSAPQEIFRIAPGVFVFATQDRTRRSVLDEAKAALEARGMHPLDVEELLVDAPGRVARAWWGGDDVGFVQENYPGAVPVTVVNMYNDRRVFQPDAKKDAGR